MKTIGIIGGTSWESTLDYYKIINQTVNDRLGGLHCAKLLLYNVEFAEIEVFMRSGHWDKCTEAFVQAALTLQKGGADFILIASNTLHKVADAVAAKITIPIINIMTLTAREINKHHQKNILLLGTAYTMEGDFCINKLTAENINVIIPEAADRTRINTIIFDELCKGIVTPTAHTYLTELINSFDDAEGVILGCTELGMIIKEADTDKTLYDTAVIHPREAALLSLT